MIYANTDGTLIGFGLDALRRARPHSSIPETLSAADLAHLGVVAIPEPARPPDTPATEYRIETSLNGSVVEAAWQAVPRTDAAARRAAWNERAVQATKAEAARRIEAQFPGWRQRRAMMDWLQLIEKRSDNEALTAAERTRIAAYRVMRARINAIADASDAIEARITAMTDAEAGSFDVTTATEWPNP